MIPIMSSCFLLLTMVEFIERIAEIFSRRPYFCIDFLEDVVFHDSSALAYYSLVVIGFKSANICKLFMSSMPGCAGRVHQLDYFV